MEEQQEQIKETPNGELTQGEFKIKKKPKKLSNNKIENAKIDLTKKQDNADTEPSAVEVSEDKSTSHIQEVEVPESEVQQIEEKVPEKEIEEAPKEEVNIISEITEEEEIKKEETPVVEEPKINLPEGVEKLVAFMNETGGDVSDYVRLNADYSQLNEDALLKEYYKNTKPHLDADEIDFIMEERFKVDEDYDEERDQRRKKLAKKEEVAKAKNFLEDLKTKYYEEIKLRPTVNNEMTKASEFFNRHKKEQEAAKKRHEDFKNTTNKMFSEEFKGFDFALGEKKFRYSVSNPQDVAEAQSDISNVLKKFLNDKGEVVDYKGYHKAIYAARNADTIANHFYEQGKADAVKDVVAKSKNISSDVRQTRTPNDIYLNGLKVKTVSGMDSSKLKIKKTKIR